MKDSTEFKKVLIAFLALMAAAPDLLAQRSPSDLANISISELLDISIDDTPTELNDSPEIEPLETPARVSAWYCYKQTRFEGYRNGTSDVSNARVLRQYPVLPTVIDQEAHIVGINYRYSDRLDVTVTIPYILQSTDHIRRVGAPFTLKSKGLGDLALNANYAALRYGTSSLVVSAGVSAPSGSIDKTGDTPRGRDTQLPYAMQIGSGTWDLHPGLTVAMGTGSWNFGSTIDATIRLGENDRDYALGDEVALTAWADYSPTSRLQLAAYVRGECWDGVEGQDSEVNPRIAPVADPATYGGCQARVGGSVRFFWLEDVYDDFFLEVGGSIPFWQDLNGPQPKQEWEFTFALGFGF